MLVVDLGFTKSYPDTRRQSLTYPSYLCPPVYRLNPPPLWAPPLWAESVPSTIPLQRAAQARKETKKLLNPWFYCTWTDTPKIKTIVDARWLCGFPWGFVCSRVEVALEWLSFMYWVQCVRSSLPSYYLSEIRESKLPFGVCFRAKIVLLAD